MSKPVFEERAVPQSPSGAEQLAPGIMLGQRYRIEQHIGSGGYASVYRAVDLHLRRERAIKELVDTDPGVRRQFEVEAGLLIKSTHPNIPRGYQLFEDRGRLYLVMEFVRGRDLEDLLNESLVQRRRPLDEAQVLRWAIEVCGALEEMHERDTPVIHRDIKPANIKITPEGKPILIDFGLAKLQTGGPTRTAAQGVSPGFAPPEQYMAKGRTDARSDIYGLGATVYACLTGKDPPEAPARLLAQTGAGGQPFVPPRELAKNMNISDATNHAVIKALELSPSHRYQSAREFRDDLEIALRLLASGAALQESGKRAVAPASSKQPAVPDPRKLQAPAVVAPPAVAPKAPMAPLASGKQPTVIAGTAKMTAAPPATARQTAVPKPTGKQTAVPAPAGGQKAGSGGPARPLGAAANGRTGKQEVVAGLPAAKPPTAKSTAGQAAAVAGALALAPSAAAVARAQREEDAARRRARAAASMLAAPLDVPRLRSWLNLHGPEIATLGKCGLALGAIETWWGVLLAALGILEAATRGAPRSKPFLLFWLVVVGVVIVVCLLGTQVLTRPIYRRGRLSRLRRGLQGFGLLVYSLAVNGVAVWGALVFAQSRPNPSLAIMAYTLYTVNILIAGILSLANTLG
jgi:tRNA A-37 threonylcarbamoyl transferase component Bud32